MDPKKNLPIIDLVIELLAKHKNEPWVITLRPDTPIEAVEHLRNKLAVKPKESLSNGKD